ncbi:MAG TPA: MBL fold metallo-hydrolase, partial [Aggregatilineales bacterium]|nr:MBL fold metallo-hydrolase [Aggregatilineales bacterium]
MDIQLLRHATLVVTVGQRRILVDPMLSRAEAMEPVANAAVIRRIPMVELPLNDAALMTLLGQLDLVIVTHTHRDHWDSRAIELLRKDLPILCQPEDVERLRSDGFTDVHAVDTYVAWDDLTVTRTGGQHGTGEIGQKMGKVSGFIFQAAGEPRLYIAGDTIWCPSVEAALALHRPDIMVVNAGAAQFLTGDPITMSAADVVQVCRACPETKVVATHMEAINHCLLTRDGLRSQVRTAGLIDRVIIPADG